MNCPHFQKKNNIVNFCSLFRLNIPLNNSACWRCSTQPQFRQSMITSLSARNIVIPDLEDKLKLISKGIKPKEVKCKYFGIELLGLLKKETCCGGRIEEKQTYKCTLKIKPVTKSECSKCREKSLISL